MNFLERVLEQHATTVAVLLLLAMVMTGIATSERSLLSVLSDAVHAGQSAAAQR
jgi:hypothetical protein